jgi:hypothetical protein
MSKVNDLPSGNASQQLSQTNLAPSEDAAKNNVDESQINLQTTAPQSDRAKPDDLMSALHLINTSSQLRNELSRKLGGDSPSNKTKDESDNEKLQKKTNLSLRQGQKISVKLSDSATTLQVLKQALKKYASEAGLLPQAQEDFVEEHAQRFVVQAEVEGLGNLLEKAGDFSLLSVDSPLSQSLNSESPLFQTELTGGNLHFNLSANAADLRQTTNSSQVNLKPSPSFTELGLNNSVAQRATIEARLPTVVSTPREFGILKAAIQKKIEDILQKLGLGEETTGETTGKTASGEAKSTEDLHLVSEFLDTQKSLKAKDTALFATAFGVATEASGKSRELHGDGVLQEFADYGGKATAAVKEANQIALAKLFQHGTQAGFPALLKAADSDFSQTNMKSVEQLQKKLGPDKTTNLVIGVVTMSVMTREVVKQLDHVTENSSMGLSDNALAALQKAHNSLRDHLTPTDVIGAVGDVKNAHVTIAGKHYNFLPEVSEALNSLREARNRILSETMGLKSGADSQQRFVREAESLFGITERIESILGT